ncbi:MAG TPA: TonB-dependent receptor [Candidatus Saccharimonadales bacterium]|nr:TonB-dependent receptor [Candidatus Saccharimonadales bacterium]
MSRRIWPFLAIALLAATAAFATVFGNVRGVVHDPQHRPVGSAHAVLAAVNSAYKQEADTNSDGVFEFQAVPLGQYTVTLDASGFVSQTQTVLVASNSTPILHYQLSVASSSDKVVVTSQIDDLNSDVPRRDIFIDQDQIAKYAGVDSSTSFKMITGFVPGSYMVHDQLHVRGGHQVTWAIDGVPVPNTNIASNVGPQFNPKDMSYLEAETGSYAAEYGDRTYGVFNVAPKNGFERDKEAELLLSYGSYNNTDDWLSFGDHTSKFAYYFSVSGNRSDYGLEPPTTDNIHNETNGGGGFTSILYNPTVNDQIRVAGGARLDYYQVPNDPDQTTVGYNDRQREQDYFVTTTWVHTFNSEWLTMLSPFYHFNRAVYQGGPDNVPTASDNRASNYEGGQATVSWSKSKNILRGGLYAFAQQDNSYFTLDANDGSGNNFAERVKPTGNMEALFVEDQLKPLPWLSLSGGLRYTHFSGEITENATDPRIGVAIQIPKLKWVLRAAYSYFYQPPPLDTVSGSLIDNSGCDGCAFLPLYGERDIQQEYGITFPIKGWTLSETYFHTSARNFFDHDALGNSNIFLPLTIQGAIISGYETVLRSPLLAHHYRAHLVYSNQRAMGVGAVTGGLTDFTPPEDGNFFLDHDQRNTLSAGLEGDLPWRSFASVAVNYGSGFLNGDGPSHLPGYYTLDLSVGKSFGESFTVRLSGTNITNQRYMLDTSNTFGGTHFADPRMLAVQVRWRFHY